MLQCVHQLTANCVFLVAYSRFLELSLWKSREIEPTCGPENQNNGLKKCLKAAAGWQTITLGDFLSSEPLFRKASTIPSEAYAQSVHLFSLLSLIIKYWSTHKYFNLMTSLYEPYMTDSGKKCVYKHSLNTNTQHDPVVCTVRWKNSNTVWSIFNRVTWGFAPQG